MGRILGISVDLRRLNFPALAVVNADLFLAQIVHVLAHPRDQILLDDRHRNGPERVRLERDRSDGDGSESSPITEPYEAAPPDRPDEAARRGLRAGGRPRPKEGYTGQWTRTTRLRPMPRTAKLLELSRPAPQARGFFLPAKCCKAAPPDGPDAAAAAGRRSLEGRAKGPCAKEG